MPIVSQIFHWCKSAGQPEKSRLSRWRSMARRIIAQSNQLKTATNQELLDRGREIRWHAKTGVPLYSLLGEAYALVREAARRTVGMQHFPVQVMGGIALFEGHVAEMQTGEGKTITAVMPAFLRALPGHGCHVITVNDYLAKRDVEMMGPIYNQLGLSVGCIQTSMESDERRDAYSKDMTYGTAKEMGFDFLRDRLRMGAVVQTQSHRRIFGRGQDEQVVQRGNHFALIDEADSILIDEARTPLIIGLTQPNDSATVNLLRWSHRATHHLEANEDFIYEPDRRSAYLTDTGCRKILMMAKPSLLDSIDSERIYSHVERALAASLAFECDRDYVVIDDEIVIVDESTGRIMEGRKWQDGLHQAVESKEQVPITAATGQAARITVQNFFRQYTHLAGMTGTAVQARRELKKTYGLHVSVIPTNQPCLRTSELPRIFPTMEAKRLAIVDEIEALHRSDRPVLVGTPSVDASEALGKLLKARGVEHQILNAKFHEREAEIVSQAGRQGQVTIATNMAGRGTDITLDDQVRNSRGLHIIATEMHSSVRIDRQLIGRAARQGDPGSSQFFLSLEDELLRCRPHAILQTLRNRAGSNGSGELPSSWLPFFQKTQRFLEKTHHKQRKHLLRQENHRADSYQKMGLDPFLELTE